MKKIYSSQNLVLIYSIKSKLDEKNIQSLIKNEWPPLGGEIPAIVASPELWVMDDNDYALASSILQQELAEQANPKENWQCPNCGEILEGQFDICWKCGKQRD